MTPDSAARVKRLGELWNSRGPVVMGIVNATPDSFSDGPFLALEAAVAEGERHLDAGALIVDIGGESTRPGAEVVDAAEEIRRVAPVIRELRKRHPSAVLSVDTSKLAVAESALSAGVDIVNDVSAGADPGVFVLVAAHDAAIVLMHRRGTPATMQLDTRYHDLVAEVHGWLRERAAAATKAGVPDNMIWLDPGIGFGKDDAGNLALLAALPEFAAVGHPVVVGPSRKSFIGRLTGTPVGDRLGGSWPRWSRASASTGSWSESMIRDRVQFLRLVLHRGVGGMNWILSFLRELGTLQVSLADAADVLVVTLLIYALLVLLRGTRAMQMLWGILIIAGLYFISRALDLITLSTILENLLAFLPIAIIVLFQREIRSMLAAFGSKSLLRWRSGQDEVNVPLNELALAVQALASKRIGALIAIELKDSLANWADTGIPLNAQFSYDLMLNIFIPGTPLMTGQWSSAATRSWRLPASFP